MGLFPIDTVRYSTPHQNSSSPDIDECSQYNGGCKQECENLIGGFRCKCGPGYVLANDNISCNGGFFRDNFDSFSIEPLFFKWKNFSFFNEGLLCKIKYHVHIKHRATKNFSLCTMVHCNAIILWE